MWIGEIVLQMEIQWGFPSRALTPNLTNKKSSHTNGRGWLIAGRRARFRVRLVRRGGR